MKKNVGLWIDHKKTVIVFLTDKDEEIKLIVSNTENHPHSGVRADDVRQSILSEYLKRYYDEVISAISSAESILIFGPGEAKGELKKRLESKNYGEKIVNVETSDEMTNQQIAAKVRNYFLNQNAAAN